MKTTRRIMIVAGEVSGDGHAAELVRALRSCERETDFEFFGAAGMRMCQAGVDPVVRSDRFSIVGLPEIALALPMFLRALRDLREAARERRPDAVILVDFPEFNLRLAKALKKEGFTVIYYISPQLWAWRKYRVSSVAKYVDLMLTILPFEKAWYAGHGVDKVEFVGHPLVGRVSGQGSRDEFCTLHGLDAERPIIALLPGSRQKEIRWNLPVLLSAASSVMDARPDVQFVIALAAEGDRREVKFAQDTLEKGEAVVPREIKTVVGETLEALAASEAAAVASGTATLETGMIGTPMVIVYRTSSLNYRLLKPLISVPHYGLINLVAEKRIAKELIQNDFTPVAVSTELLRLLEPAANQAMRAELKAAAGKLGPGDGSTRAAKAILAEIDRDRHSQ